jgi:hypothetical protein
VPCFGSLCLARRTGPSSYQSVSETDLAYVDGTRQIVANKTAENRVCRIGQGDWFFSNYAVRFPQVEEGFARLAHTGFDN